MERLIERKRIRIKNYDYSQAGYYFITICTMKRQSLFWKVGASCARLELEEHLSFIGHMVYTEIKRMNSIYQNVKIDKFVVMPNHVHMIVILYDDKGRSKTAPTISRIIQQFKGSITKKAGSPVWQKSYYDHIIRNEHEYQEIWHYIDTNPIKWEEDKYFI